MSKLIAIKTKFSRILSILKPKPNAAAVSAITGILTYILVSNIVKEAFEEQEKVESEYLTWEINLLKNNPTLSLQTVRGILGRLVI